MSPSKVRNSLRWGLDSLLIWARVCLACEKCLPAHLQQACHKEMGDGADDIYSISLNSISEMFVCSVLFELVTSAPWIWGPVKMFLFNRKVIGCCGEIKVSSLTWVLSIFYKKLLMLHQLLQNALVPLAGASGRFWGQFKLLKISLEVPFQLLQPFFEIIS